MNVWIFQSGEPIHLDGKNVRPMRAINLSNMLIKKNHRVILWSSSFHHQKKKFRSRLYKKITINKNLEIRLIPSSGYKRNISIKRLFDHFILALNLKKYLYKEKNLPDVAFIGYPPIEPAFVLSNWLKEKKVPFLLDVKDKWPHIFVETTPKILQPLIKILFLPYFLMAKETFKSSTGFCSISKSFITWSLKFANRKKNNYDIISSLTSPNYNIKKIEEKLSYRWWKHKGVTKNNQFKIIFIGSFSRQFDFDLIFKTVKIISKEKINCEFILCGNGELNSKLRKDSKKYQNIKVIKSINEPKIITLSKMSSLFIAPYKNTDDFIISIPNKVIDALKLGMPILSPLQGEVENLIKNHKVGMMYTSPLSLANKIKLLMADQDLLKNFSKNAKKLYKDNFEFNKVYDDLVNNLNKIKNLNS